MADSYTPTVVVPIIPNSDMTSLERFLLSAIFDATDNGKETFFWSQTGPNDTGAVDRADLEATVRSLDAESISIADEIKKQILLVPSDEPKIDLDLTLTPYTALFQNIIQRSRTLRYVTLISAFTCTKTRPDGFGGNVIFITAGQILCKSTFDVLDDFLAQAGLDEHTVNTELTNEAQPSISRWRH